MEPLSLHEIHQRIGARFDSVNGKEVVRAYRDWLEEYRALNTTAAVLDLSFRSRVCLTGSDRVRFLHGQVTNDIKKLGLWDGCYAALVTAKGRIESDLNIYVLEDELLLDFEPGLTQTVTDRLTKYIVADDVQVVDVAPYYGLLSIQGPAAANLLTTSGLVHTVPGKLRQVLKITHAQLGDLYLTRHPRCGTDGFDLFVPSNSLAAAFEMLGAAATTMGGSPSGWEALEASRIEAGIPRFGADIDVTNFPQECGIEEQALSYTKGCYIGQEVLNRIHTMGHVNRMLIGLTLPAHLDRLPTRGDKLLRNGSEVGTLTSAAYSPRLAMNVALGLVRREVLQPGTALDVASQHGTLHVQLVSLPFGST